MEFQVPHSAIKNYLQVPFSKQLPFRLPMIAQDLAGCLTDKRLYPGRSYLHLENIPAKTRRHGPLVRGGRLAKRDCGRRQALVALTRGCEQRSSQRI